MDTLASLYADIHSPQINTAGCIFQLLLSMLLGSIVGFERRRRGQSAGVRTFSLIAMGSTLAMILSIYVPQKYAGVLDGDPTRIAAQVISGIGFLGAGAIIQMKGSVRGLTTAAGLWASACMGLAIGAGFYECMFLAFALIFLCICLLPHIDAIIVSHAHNMNIYVEFTSLDDVGAIIGKIKEQGARIYEVDIIQDRKESALYPCAVFSIRLGQPRTHGRMIMAIYELDRVIAIDEV